MARDEAYSVTIKPDEFEYDFTGGTVIVKVNGETVDTYSLLEIPTQGEDLLDAMSTHAGLMVWMGIAMGDAEISLQLEKESKRRIEALLDIQVREDAAAAGEKITEAMVAARIILQPEYDESSASYFKALRKYTILKTIYEAFRQRGEIIRSIAATIRDESRQPYAGN